MKRYIRSTSDYFYWIYYSKNKDADCLIKNRTDSILECRTALEKCKQEYGNSCVITVKELGTNRWIYTRRENI